MSIDKWNAHGYSLTPELCSGNRSPWEAKIGFAIPRSPHADTTGDASFLGGGGYSRTLKYWFQILWSPQVCTCCTHQAPSNKLYIHINTLEFLVLVVKLATTIQFFGDLQDEDVVDCFLDDVCPVMPIVHDKADNTPSLGWLQKATPASVHGQKLLGLFAALLELEEVGINGSHIRDVDNDQADLISRPTDLSLSPSQMSEQLFQTYPIMRHRTRFLLSPKLLQILYSQLFKPLSPTPVVLRPVLGKFVLGEYIISCSQTV